MLQVALRKTCDFCAAKNRWWLAAALGLTYGISLPPFNHQTHPLLALFPFATLIVLLPLLGLSTIGPARRAAWYTYLYGTGASLSQFYWIAFVTAEGLWHLILLGVLMICVVFGFYYLALGMLFRLVRRHFPRSSFVVFPAVLVLLEYGRTLGEMSFPWCLLGYGLAPVLPLAQLASVSGVFGLSFLAAAANVLLWNVGAALYRGDELRIHARRLAVLAAVVALAGAWGWWRLVSAGPSSDRTVAVACVQGDIDQTHWGANSLDSSFDIAESLVYRAARERPSCIVLSESALLCYLDRRPLLARRVLRWVDSVGIPIVVGALHWEPAPSRSPYDYLVYNTAFLYDERPGEPRRYYKMRLAPFSEAIPFEGLLPILSRVNLGEADFKKGTDPVVFPLGPSIRGVPLICYEVIYPGFVRRRLKEGANLLVNITNDGWFGRTSGPYQHAEMARMRCIENGVSMARCANSGVSMLCDQYGRVLARTALYTRTVLSGAVPVGRTPTLYGRLGDWPVGASLALLVLAAAGKLAGAVRARGLATARS
jgi:apolipoprotein N-acyltransferase